MKGEARFSTKAEENDRAEIHTNPKGERKLRR